MQRKSLTKPCRLVRKPMKTIQFYDLFLDSANVKLNGLMRRRYSDSRLLCFRDTQHTQRSAESTKRNPFSSRLVCGRTSFLRTCKCSTLRFPGSCLCPLHDNSIKNSGDAARYRLGPPRQTRFNSRRRGRTAASCRMSQETAQTCNTDKTSCVTPCFVGVCVHVKLACASAACIFWRGEGGEGKGRNGGSLLRKASGNGTRLHHSFPGAMSRDALDKAWRRLLVVGSGLPSLAWETPHMAVFFGT